MNPTIHPIKLVSLLLTGLFGVILAATIFFGGFYTVEGGKTAVIQNTLTGQIDIARGPKFGLKMPFFSSVETFVDVSTISFGASTDQNTRNLDPIRVLFADTYKSDLSLSFRFRLPTDDKQMLALFTDYRRYDNTVDSLFVKNAVNVTTVTGTQFTGEEFFQGGVNQYKERLEDQMKSGIYQTERKQVEIEQLELASVGLDNSNANNLQVGKQLVWKTVPVLDANNVTIRQSNPFQRYGIEVTQITYTGAVPEELLEKLLTDKKTLVAARIRTIQEQETAKAEADTAQLLKEIERTKAVQDANRQKELAVIAESQQVSVAQQQALKETVTAEKTKSLAVIDKQRELEIAEANLEIQRANAASSIEQAKALTAIGLAEAQVTDAKYKALGGNSAIYLAEIQRDINLALYNNLGNFKVEMPTNLITSNNSGLSTNLDILSSYAALGSMSNLSATAAAPATR